MHTLEVKGLRLYGYHGVELEEQKQGQEYIFDCKIESEEIIDYLEVIKEIEGVNKLPTKFIEELAEGIAIKLIQRFSAKIEITVKKPNPPICYFIDYASATSKKIRA
ncbi:MAG: dihydroneopterin aldolase [bacterium]|nr:dihydroneopterin aldolase [bacterium]